ncbi:T9SS type A sorting domain-containing protein, partial [bacterium]|nr:T9SS type A sorting domain-containing protein [bacterium]
FCYDSIIVSYGYHLFSYRNITTLTPVFSLGEMRYPPPPPGHYFTFGYYFCQYECWLPPPLWEYTLEQNWALPEIGEDGPNYPTEFEWSGGYCRGDTLPVYISEFSTRPVEFMEFNKKYSLNRYWGNKHLLTQVGLFNLAEIDTSNELPVYYPATNIFDGSSYPFCYLLSGGGYICDAFLCMEFPNEGYSYIRNTVYSYGLTNSPSPGFVAIDEDLPVKKPQAIRILKTYPEPFNSQFTIAYTIPRNTNNLTKLKIYDMNGKLVKEKQIPSSTGFHSKIVNCKDMPSGIYFTSVISGNMKDTKTVTLIK